MSLFNLSRLVPRVFNFLPEKHKQIILIYRTIYYNHVKIIRNFVASKVPKYILPVALSQLSFLKKIDTEATGHEIKALLTKVDKLYDERNFETIKELLEKNDLQNDEVLWRLGRATYEIAQQSSNKTEQLQQIEKASKFIEKALEINENNGYAHKWYAILLNTISTQKGVKEQIQGGPRIKKHLQEAIKNIPNDPTSHYLLGYWFYSVADLTWYEKQIAALIYGKIPGGTYEEAIKCFETAEKLEPLFYNMNLLLLGKTYLKLKQLEQAKDALTKAKDFPISNPKDEKIRDEATSLLKSHKL